MFPFPFRLFLDRLAHPVVAETSSAIAEHWNEVPTEMLAARVNLATEDFGGLPDWLNSDFYRGRYNKSVLPLLEKVIRDTQKRSGQVGVLLNGASGMSIAARRMATAMRSNVSVIDLHLNRRVVGDASNNDNGHRWVADYHRLQGTRKGVNTIGEIFKYIQQKGLLESDNGALVDTAFNGSIIKLVSQIIFPVRSTFRIKGYLALQMSAEGMPAELEIEHGAPFVVSNPKTDMEHFEKLGPRQFRSTERLVEHGQTLEPETAGQNDLVDYVFVRQYLEALVDEYLQ
jgi:hypothetical protein